MGLTDDSFRIVSQSQDKRGDFITWTLVGVFPVLIRRDYVKVINETNNNNVEKFDENVDPSDIIVRKNYLLVKIIQIPLLKMYLRFLLLLIIEKMLRIKSYV